MKAQADAKSQADQMLADANKQIADIAIAATEKLLGRELAKKKISSALLQSSFFRNSAGL